MEELYKKYGYPSYEKFKLRLKKDKISYNDKEIRDFLNKQVPEQMMKRVKKPKVFNTIRSSEVGQNFQMDIINYDRYSLINGYRYIFMCIDVYSRFLYARAMTNREMNTIMESIYKAFEVLGKPDNINCDNEFNKNEINKMADDLGIRMWYSHPLEVNKNAIVERCNRTIAEMIQKWRLGSGRTDWYKVLDEIVDAYNHQFHKTIKATPFDVFNERAVNKQKITNVQSDLKVGDVVRIQQQKGVFSKGDEPRYSKEAYKINIISGKKYTLEGEKGNKRYKPYELRRVDTEPTGRINIIRREPRERPIERQAERRIQPKRSAGVPSRYLE